MNDSLIATLKRLRLFRLTRTLLFLVLPILTACQESKGPEPLTSPAADEPAHKAPLILDMVHHNPGEKPYDSAYEDPQVIKAMGYEGKVYFLFDSPTLAINWESVDPDILPPGSPDRDWVDAKAASIRQKHAACKKAGIRIFAQADLILFPKRLIEKYQLADVFGDPKHPETQKFLRAQIDETFKQFPDLEGLVVRIGETYLHDAPFHEGKINDKYNAEETIIPLISLLREELIEKRGKTLIFRTWGSFDKGTKPEDFQRYQTVSAAIEPHPDLSISIKHVEGDFHRSNPFSKNIGQGRHRQIIEVQCAREYEGKGAYPNYVLQGVIDGFEEHDRMPGEALNSIREFVETKPELFGGIWTWTRGGGWGGPYPPNELWCDLNAWVGAQWARDTSQSEEDIFNRYAVERLKLQEADIPAFRQLCLLSAQAVVRGRNSTQGDMNPWWTRDAGIGWPRLNNEEPHYSEERNLKQKDESVAMWKEIIGLAESIQWPDDATRTFAVGSCHYGHRLYRIYRALVYLDVAERNKDAQSVKKWIQEYDQAWDHYKKLPQEFDSLATLYEQDYNRHIRNNAHQKIATLRTEYDLNP